MRQMLYVIDPHNPHTYDPNNPDTDNYYFEGVADQSARQPAYFEG